MSDYRLVSTLHAARVTLANARKAGDAAAVTAAEAQVAAARAAVDAALADGRVASAAHLLDLDLDCLGAILSHLGPDDALSTARTCTTLRSALFRGGLPWPLAGVSRKSWYEDTPTTAAALRALDDMEPALGALRLQFRFGRFGEDCARMLARALEVAPRAARIDITLPSFSFIDDDQAGRLINILSSPDRAFASPPQIHLDSLSAYDDNVDVLRRLTRAGVCVASMQRDAFNIDSVVRIAANTLTQLSLKTSDTINLTTRLPALRRLSLAISQGDEFTGEHEFTTNAPSLTELAPLLKEIEFVRISTFHHDHHEPQKYGFGLDPGPFARFVAAIDGVTRVCFGPRIGTTLYENENENLEQLAALHTLRELEISTKQTYVELKRDPLLPPYSPGSDSFEDDFRRHPVAEEVITDLPPLAPGLTRLAFSGSVRVAFDHPLPELRVLDWRGAHAKVDCVSFNWKDGDDEYDEGYDLTRTLGGDDLRVPLAIPSAALAPNLHTLFIGFKRLGEYNSTLNRGDFDLWTLVAARTPLRVVVIEHARLMCSAPAGFDATPAGFAARLAHRAKDLVSVHKHGSTIKRSHQPAVENFLRAVEQRGGRVCRTGIGTCLFGMLHDGTDLWPPKDEWDRYDM